MHPLAIIGLCLLVVGLTNGVTLIAVVSPLIGIAVGGGTLLLGGGLLAVGLRKASASAPPGAPSAPAPQPQPRPQPAPRRPRDATGPLTYPGSGAGAPEPPPVPAPLSEARTQQDAGVGPPKQVPSDGLVGEGTISHAFAPDLSVQAVPGLIEIYERIQSGEIRGYIAVISGPDRRKGVALGEVPITIGRGEHNTFRLNDASVSHDQVTIVCERDKVFATDSRSKNGTFVNNQRISSIELQTGDVIAFGQTKMVVTLPMGF